MNKKTAFMTNIIPSQRECIEMKSPAKGKKTYTLSAKVLKSVYDKAKKVGRKPTLIITIPIDDKEFFKVNAVIYKEKRI